MIFLRCFFLVGLCLAPVSSAISAVVREEVLERYASREEYLAKVKVVVEKLIGQRFLAQGKRI